MHEFNVIACLFLVPTYQILKQTEFFDKLIMLSEDYQLACGSNNLDEVKAGEFSAILNVLYPM
jgi:hypothetical protein